MGARQSKRSVDISSTPKKDAGGEGAPAEKLEKIEEGDVKVQNGHAEPVTQESGEDGKATAGDSGEKEASSPAGDKEPVVNGDATEQSGESSATSPTAEKADAAPTSPTTEAAEAAKETPKSEEKSEKKKKDKSKKKWSFRSISFSKKDKTKPSMSKDDSKQDLAKEAPVPEEGAQKAEEASPSTAEATSPASEEPAKETPAPAATETKKEEPAPTPAPVVDVKSVVSSITSVAESGVQQVVEETTKIVTEAKEAVNTIVETATKTVVEEIKSQSQTTITELASITKTSTKTIDIVEETIAPPLPASPPPTEAPPPTPVAPQPIQQHEHEEMNGGGEGMAEMPEENGLGENEKIDDEPEHEMPKMNGHTESPVKQVEEITECLLKTSIEEKVVVDNHLNTEVAVGKDNQD